MQPDLPNPTPPGFRRLPPPQRVTLQINYSCNQRCLHCYQDAGPHLAARDRQPVPEFDRLLGPLRDLGFQELKIMGGEPLLYPRLVELLEQAGNYGFRTSLITGGSAGDRPTWERVAGLVEAVWFSIYHVDDEIHDRLVQHRGALAALWRHHEALAGRAKAGFHLLLNRPLLADLAAALTLLCQKGAGAIKILWPSPEGAAARHWPIYDISPHEWSRIAGIAAQVRSLFPGVTIALARHAMEEGEDLEDSRGVCSYGDRKLWGVDPRGLLYPCCLLMEREEYAIGPLDGLTSGEIESRVLAMAERDRRRQVGPFSGCGTCPALLSESGEDRRAAPGWLPVCPLLQVEIGDAGSS